MTTLRELLTGTLRLLNVVQDGETPSASDLELARDAMNVMVDNWSADKLYIYKSRPFEFAITPGKSSYTLGTGADWNTPRPMNIDMAYIKYTPYVPVTPAPTPPPPPPPPTPVWSDVVLLLPTNATFVWNDYSSYYQQPLNIWNIYGGGLSQSGTWTITTGTEEGTTYGILLYSIEQFKKNSNWTLEFDAYIGDNHLVNQDFMALFDYDPGMSLADPVYPSDTAYCSYNNDNGYYEMTLKSYSGAGEDISIPYKWAHWITICICQNVELGKIFYYANGVKIAESTNLFTSSSRQVLNVPSAKQHIEDRDLKPGSKLANIRYTMFALRDGTDYTVTLPYPIGSI